MNATMSYCFLPFAMKAICVLYNEVSAKLAMVKRLQWFWRKSSKSRAFDLVECFLHQPLTSSGMSVN